MSLRAAAAAVLSGAIFDEAGGASVSETLMDDLEREVRLAQPPDTEMVTIRRSLYESLAKVAEKALEPDGSHRLIDGYCPDCQGGCLKGFGAEPVRHVEPSPFGPSR